MKDPPVAGRLQDERALVTGSTTGIGAAIAELFAAAGAAVVVTGRDARRGQAVVDRIRAAGGMATFVAADLLVEEQRERLVATSAVHLGGLSILVNCASVAQPPSDITSIAPDAWAAQLEIDALVPGVLAGLVIPHMLRAGHGSIVNVSSRVAATATAGRAPSVVAKAALNALGRSITAEYARTGIRCNALQVGWVSDGTRAAGTDSAAEMQATRPVKQGDVALAALFLASAESETITGAVLPVDGGATVVRAASLG